MYRLLIADDEALEREGLELMIHKMFPNTFSIYHASNGRTAIQLAEETRPDIVFMDINMPGIHGLEALGEIQEQNPRVKMVLVTAYDYFNYAQQAVTLGVSEYMLKPARREHLHNTLSKLLDELNKDRSKRNEELELREKLSRLLPLVENEITLLLMIDQVQEATVHSLAEMLGLTIDKGYAMVLSFAQKEKEEAERFHARKEEIYETIKQTLKSRISCLVSPMIGSQMAVFIPLSLAKRSYSHRVEAIQLARKVKGHVESTYESRLSVGIGTLHERLEGLRESYHEAALALSDSYSAAQVQHYEDIQLHPQWQGFQLTEEQELLRMLKVGGGNEAVQLFHQMFDRLFFQSNGDMDTVRVAVIGLFATLSRQLLHAGIILEEVHQFHGVSGREQLRDMAAYRIGHLHTRLHEVREKRTLDMMERAKMHIVAHFTEDISMEQVAELVNLSPFYFSKVFKSHAGETFIEYLTRLRIDKAKKLIGNQDLSLKEICFQSGYNDPNYFSRVFKKWTGMTPREYRTFHSVSER